MLVLISQQLKAEINLGPCDVPVATALLDFLDPAMPINADKQNFRVINGKIIYKNTTHLISKEISDKKHVYAYKDAHGIKRKIEISKSDDEIIIQKTRNTRITDDIIDARSGKKTSISEQVFPSDKGYVYYKFKIKNDTCSLNQYGEETTNEKKAQVKTIIYDAKFCIQANSLKNEYCANKLDCPDIFFEKSKDTFKKRNSELLSESQMLGDGNPEHVFRVHNFCKASVWKGMGFEKFLDPFLTDEDEDGNNGTIKMPNPNTRKKANI